LITNICAEEPILVTARVNGVSLSDLDPPAEAEVEVLCLGVDPLASTLTADPRSLPADGASASTITVTPIGVDAIAMGSGLTVEVDATLGALTPVFDEGDGTYTCMLTSTEPGEAEVTASVGGVAIDAHANVVFLDEKPEGEARIELTPTLSDGLPGAGATITVTVEVLNTGDASVADGWMSLAVPTDMVPNVEASTWADQQAAIVYSEEGSIWAVELGDIDVSDTPTTLQLVLDLDAQVVLPATLVFQVFDENDVVSDEVPLMIEAAAVAGGGTATVDACSCGQGQASGALPAALVALYWAFGVLRRRSRSPASPS
jgi:hypothetical protein